MATILEDLIVFLPTQGLGLTFGTNLFGASMPDRDGVPDNIVSLFEYPGQPPEYTMGPAAAPALAHPRFQVVVRGSTDDYLTPRRTIESITLKLEAVMNQTINGTYYERIERLQDPFALHRDVNRRHFVACNYHVTKAG